jgi:hypothetical protein
MVLKLWGLGLRVESLGSQTEAMDQLIDKLYTAPPPHLLGCDVALELSLAPCAHRAPLRSDAR